ncbi:hypothetical protein [Pseudonocardia spinosispora]|uniref:hypothetical protein n=1 Tax=Pseudonocardia spinosispora TaxID=103441 RepID=UPI000428EB09|nr:hypothetical protein [Pseudonocardia spinosispora]
MNEGPFLLVLIIGAVIVLVNGHLLWRLSPDYLAEAYHDPRRARQVAALVTMLFHLVMFGLVALVASVGFLPDAGLPSILRRVGVLLIMTAIGHIVAMSALSRLRDQQTNTEIAEGHIADAHASGHPPAPERGQQTI